MISIARIKPAILSAAMLALLANPVLAQTTPTPTPAASPATPDALEGLDA